MRNIIKSLTFIGAMFVASQSHALLIDSFNTATQYVNSSGTLTSTQGGAMLGGFRQLDIISSTGPLNTSASVVVGAGLGIFSQSEDVATSGISRVTWNANGSGLSVDLTGNDAFILDTLTIDQGSIDVTIGLTDTDSTDFVTLSNITSSNSLPTISFYSFSGINFASINEIYMEINAGQASDITLNEIRTMGAPIIVNPIPSPATFLLMGAGLLGIMGRRRRNITR